jgi:hypothetical protein
MLQRNSFNLEILGRYLLPTLSFSILLLEIKLLNTHDFKVFAVSAAASGWIVWVSDFGLTGYLTILIENGNRFKASFANFDITDSCSFELKNFISDSDYLCANF